MKSNYNCRISVTIANLNELQSYFNPLIDKYGFGNIPIEEIESIPFLFNIKID